MSIYVSLFMSTVNMNVNNSDRHDDSVEALQTYPQNLNLAGLLNALILP